MKHSKTRSQDDNHRIKKDISPSDPSCTEDSDLFCNKAFFERSQAAGRIGSFILEISDPRPEKQRWHFSSMMYDIFGLDSSCPKTGEGWLSLIVGREKVSDYFTRQVIQNHSSFDMQYQIRRHSDGVLRWIAGRGDIEYDSKGTPARLIGTVQDITDQKNADDQLRLFRSAVENSSDAIFWFNDEGRFTYVNTQACRYLGYSTEELLRLYLWDVSAVFKKERWKKDWHEFKKQHMDERIIETDLTCKDGSALHVEVGTSHLWDENIEIHIAIARDITERQAADEKLNLFQSAIDRSLDAVIWFDNSGTITYANRLACSSLGYPREEMIGLHTWDINAAFTEEDWNLKWKKYSLQKPEDAVLELLHKRKDGTVFPVEIGTLRLLNKGEEINIATIRDISARKKAEQQLELFRSASEKSTDAIFWVNQEGGFSYVNPQACSSLGYIKEDLLRMTIWDIDPAFPKNDWDKNWKEYPDNHKDGEVFETFHTRSDGSIIPVEISTILLPHNDSFIHVAAARDITDRKKWESKLLESEGRTQNIINALPLGMHTFHVDETGRLIFDSENPAGNQISRINHLPMAGKPIEEAISDLAGTEFPERYKDIAINGSSYSGEQNVFFPGCAEPVPFEVNAFQIAPKQMAIVFSNISERKKKEEEIKFQNLLLKTQQETSPEGILIVGEAEQILYVNRKFAQMWGIPDEVIATGSDEQTLQCTVSRTAEPEPFYEKVMYLYSHRDESSFDEFSLKDGRIFERLSSPIVGDDRKYYGRVWYFRDVTEQKKAEEALRINEAEFRTLFEATPSGAVMLLNRKFKRVSTRFTQITGYSEAELCGQPTRVVYPDDETSDYVGKELYSTMAKDGLGRCETHIKRKDGRLIDILIYALPLDPADPAKGVAATIEDISLRKKAEDEKERMQEELIQAQKMESIGRLAGGIAHDFNNLLTAIIGNTELALLHVSQTDHLYTQLSTVMQAAESAADLTRQLLSFSRKQIIDPKVVNLNTLITTMHKMLVRVLGENINLRSSTQADLHNVKVDISQIQQIIMNLSINARDAMPYGGTLTIETANVVLDASFCQRHSYPVQGDHVMIAVTDTGAGMSQNVQEHLFEPFFTTKAIGKGTGLGLATVYGAVKQNSGTIDVYSEEGKGTCFKVYFAAVESDIAEMPGSQETNALPGGSETILLVEDNPLVLQFTEGALRLLGYNVLTATSGEDALLVSEKTSQKIDMLMTDVVLPGINGKTLAEKIGELRPGIKILFNSGYTEDAIVAHGVLQSGLHFIGKPFSAFSLAHKVRQVIES